MYGSEMWDRADYVRPVCLNALQSDNAHTFLIVVGEGWHDHHCGETSLQCLQRRTLLGLETHCCRVNSTGWCGSHWRPIGRSPRHENFDYCATGEVIDF